MMRGSHQSAQYGGEKERLAAVETSLEHLLAKMNELIDSQKALTECQRAATNSMHEMALSSRTYFEKTKAIESDVSELKKQVERIMVEWASSKPVLDRVSSIFWQIIGVLFISAASATLAIYISYKTEQTNSSKNKVSATLAAPSRELIAIYDHSPQNQTKQLI